MAPPARRPRRAPALLLGSLLLATTAAGDGRHPFPYRLQVAVVRGELAPPRTVVREFLLDLAGEISARGCFLSAEPRGPGNRADADLLLEVTLDGYLEQTRYELSMAERLDARDEEELRKLVAEFSVAMEIELLTLPARSPVRAAAEPVERLVRPVMPGQDDDDARAIARRRGIEDMVRLAAFTACRGSVRKLRRRVEAARRL